MSFAPSQTEIDAFCAAARQGDCAAITVFLNKHGNATIDSLDYQGSPALVGAAIEGYEDAVRLLLDKGASIEPRKKGNMAALVFAASNGHRHIVALLLERGALIDAQGGSDGRSALMWAALFGHTDIVEFLLERGASAEVKDFNDQTAVMHARRCGKEDVVVLIEHYPEIKREKAYVATVALTETRLQQLKQLPKPVLKKGM